MPTPAAISNDASIARSDVETSISVVGERLGRVLGRVIGALPDTPSGPVRLARTLGIDKVLASRTLKALRHKDPIAVVFLAPGPDPLRRLIRAASKRGVNASIIEQAESAVDLFDRLIQHQGGDRSALEAMISGWLPEARNEFQLRRKQAAFKAMSQLKGVMADTLVATVLLHPSMDATHLDIVWVSGLLGLQRLRPGATVKFATRRVTGGDSPRRPRALSGEPIDSLNDVRLERFCSAPSPRLGVERIGEVVHYTLASDGFGPQSAVDLVFAELNLAELPRYVPAAQNRKGYVFAEVNTPAKALHFDVFVHEGVYPHSTPMLHIYDTSFDGVANVNDRTRDVDRLEVAESIQPLNSGLLNFRSAHVTKYADLTRTVFGSLGWNPDQFRGYRCRIDYPIYGSQVVMAFDAPPPPSGASSD